MRRTQACVLSLVAGSAFLLPGCVGSWQQAKFQRDIETVFRLPAGDGIHVRTRNGAVELTEVVRDDVLVRASVRATTQERADAVRVVGVSADGALQISAVWPDARKGSEGVSFVIEAPGGRPVDIGTGNGRVTIAGFAGGVKADSSNGQIDISGHDGPLDLRTSNGKIIVTDATGAVDAETSNGSVTVRLTDGASGPVDIDTSNGSIGVIVGPGFAGTVHTDTSNGSIRVHNEAGAGQVEMVQDAKTEKVVRVRGGETESTLDTSNGSVDVTVRG
ncbi:MAG: DUF4097 family beta strand repeat protein [Planctomycetota bacterium]|nr:MAG: DUF4097 family beta strand repeat protein [Planctomycetota bacterium]